MIEIREPVRRLVEIGLPDDWDDISESKAMLITDISTQVEGLEQLSYEESFLLAQNLRISDLDGVGSGIIDNILLSSGRWHHDKLKNFYDRIRGNRMREKIT